MTTSEEMATHTHGHADGTTHVHEHTHADGTTHVHAHSHAHGHGHAHHHDAPVNGAIDAKTMLAYQVDHNRQHAAELRALAETLEGASKDMVLEAAGMFEAGSEKLAEALEAMEA